MLTYDIPALWQTGSRNLTGQKTLLVDFYTHWTYMLIFRCIFLSNYWWQKSDIWSQASYRYLISWEAFLNPSEKNATKNEHICSMCIKINKVGKQEVGIRWVQKRFPRYEVPIWSLWPYIRFLPSIVVHIEHICTFFITFFSATIDDRDLIFGYKCHIGTPYRGKRFCTHQIPTLWSTPCYEWDLNSQF
jgi:hypothetical protein